MIHILLRGNKQFILLFFLLLSITSYGQSKDSVYLSYISKAQKHLSKKEYEFANNTYQQALRINDKSMLSLFNHGWCYAQRQLWDSTYFCWNVVYQTDWELLFEKSSEKKIWKEFSQKSTNLKLLNDSLRFKYSQLDTILIEELKKISFLDQLYRGYLSDSTRKEFGRNSLQDKIILEKRRVQDEENLQVVEKIIAQKGYPSSKSVGKKYTPVLFLIIQHSNLQTMKKYLPLLRDVALKGDISLKTLVLMEDRVALGEGKKQLYGTQVMTSQNGKSHVRPIEDPDNLDKRRKEIGLSPMSEYVKKWEIVWNLDEYKQKLAEYEEIEKSLKN